MLTIISLGIVKAFLTSIAVGNIVVAAIDLIRGPKDS
jgi:hypothetical protein